MRALFARHETLLLNILQASLSKKRVRLINEDNGSSHAGQVECRLQIGPWPFL